MVRFSQIVQDVVHGCTAHNIDETRVSDFVITYYVDGEKLQSRPMRLGEIENELYRIVAENLRYDRDVHIYKVTTRTCQYGKYPNNVAGNYHYSLQSFLDRMK